MKMAVFAHTSPVTGGNSRQTLSPRERVEKWRLNLLRPPAPLEDLWDQSGKYRAPSITPRRGNKGSAR